jgi:hypothetical protein
MAVLLEFQLVNLMVEVLVEKWVLQKELWLVVKLVEKKVVLREA